MTRQQTPSLDAGRSHDTRHQIIPHDACRTMLAVKIANRTGLFDIEQAEKGKSQNGKPEAFPDSGRIFRVFGQTSAVAAKNFFINISPYPKR